MIDIYCHIHTPINIEEDSHHFLPPIIYEGKLYVIKEKKLHDVLIFIDYFKEYINFARENGYSEVPKWLNKKNLLNSNFLEAVSKYWIEDINIKQICNYKYFQKNDENKAIIPEKYFGNIVKKILLYDCIKGNHEKFNEFAEKKLNIIENELSLINVEQSLKVRQQHYKNNIFKILLNNFLEFIDFEEQYNELNNIKICSENLLSQYDLFVYRVGCINGYKDFNFKLTKTAFSECLRENSFIKLNVYSDTGYYQGDYLKNLLENFKLYSQSFTNDMIDFGIEHLNKLIKCEAPITKKMSDVIRYTDSDQEYSNVALLQKTQTIISETEEHIISRYNSLRNYTNIYFAPDAEMTKLLVILNLEKDKLKRINNIIWEKPNKNETELIKFTFKKGNLPYSAFGFASLNF